MSLIDRITYEEGDVEVKESYCSFCINSIKDSNDACKKYPNGKPQEIKDMSKLCNCFEMVE